MPAILLFTLAFLTRRRQSPWTRYWLARMAQENAADRALASLTSRLRSAA